MCIRDRKGTVPGFTQALRHLPVAGLTGTLGTRFTAAPEAPAAGLVRAKTGSVSYTHLDVYKRQQAG